MLRVFGAALLVGLVGCGGGGGGGGGSSGLPQPPSTPVAISAANSNQVADAALDPAVGGTGTVGTVSATQASTSNPRVVTRALQAVARQARTPRSSTGTAVDAVETQPCAESGSITIDTSPDGTSARVTFNSCSDFPGQVINGSMTMSGVVDNGTSFQASFSVDVTFSEAGLQPLRLVGSYSISETCDSSMTNCTGTFSGGSLGAAHGNEVWFIHNFAITTVDNGSTVQITASYTVSSSDLGGSVSVNTNGPIVFAAGAWYPQSGIIDITGAANSRARITITSSDPNVADAVQVQIDANGDGGFETTNNYSWTQLEAV